MVAERFGWTLEYIDSLDLWEFNAIVTVLDAQAKAKEFLAKREQAKAKRKRR